MSSMVVVASESAPADWILNTQFGLLQECNSERRFSVGKEVRYGHYDLRLGCHAPVEHRSRPRAFRPAGSRSSSAGSVDDQAITARSWYLQRVTLVSWRERKAICFFSRFKRLYSARASALVDPQSMRRRVESPRAISLSRSWSPTFAPATKSALELAGRT
jgi:hypothetical protein